MFKEKLSKNVEKKKSLAIKIVLQTKKPANVEVENKIHELSGK